MDLYYWLEGALELDFDLKKWEVDFDLKKCTKRSLKIWTILSASYFSFITFENDALFETDPMHFLENTDNLTPWSIP